MNLNNTLDDIEYFYRVYGQELIPGEPEWSELTEAQRNGFEQLRQAIIEYGNDALKAENKRLKHEVTQEPWQTIDTAPKDGTEVLAWREDCGVFIASYTSLEAFPLSDSEIEAFGEDVLFFKDWFTQWPEAIRLEGSEVPTHWQHLPPEPNRMTSPH